MTPATIIERHKKHGPSGLVVSFNGVFQAGVPGWVVGLPTPNRDEAEKTADRWVSFLRRRH